MYLETFPRIPDEDLERWAAVYQEPDINRRLRARGITYEKFLLAPKLLLESLDKPLRLPSRPGLLPAQREAQKRADFESALVKQGEREVAAVAAEAHCADGAWTEKIRHRAWPRRKPRRMAGVR